MKELIQFPEHTKAMTGPELLFFLRQNPGHPSSQTAKLIEAIDKEWEKALNETLDGEGDNRLGVRA